MRKDSKEDKLLGTLDGKLVEKFLTSQKRKQFRQFKHFYTKKKYLFVKLNIAFLPL